MGKEGKSKTRKESGLLSIARMYDHMQGEGHCMSFRNKEPKHQRSLEIF